MESLNSPEIINNPPNSSEITDSSPVTTPINLTPKQKVHRQSKKTAIEEFKKLSAGFLKQIDGYRKELFEDQAGKKSVKNQINDTCLDIEEKSKKVNDLYTEIEQFHSKLLVSSKEEDSIKDDVVAVQTEINEILELVNKNKNEFVEYYEKVFNPTKGLKQELENKESQFKMLFEKIEGLLPGATSAGLAETYQTQAKKYSVPTFMWSFIFIAAMIGMAVFSAISILPKIIDAKTITEALGHVITRLPFFVPAVWLGCFASKQQSQNKRLAQEYAYKANLAKSFVGYKEQIKVLGQTDENKEVLVKLLNALVVSVSYNPSETLNKNYHKDSPPLFTQIIDRMFGGNRIKNKEEKDSE